MEIKLPDGWNEVTISQFQEIANTQGEDRMIDVIAILSDRDPEEIGKMNMDSLAKIIHHLEWIKEMPKEGSYKPNINIDGEDYGFINRMSDLNTGNWVDLERWLVDANANIHKIMAMFYRPLISAVNDSYRVVDKYVSAEAAIRADLFKEKMLISDCYGAMLFFSLIEKEFIMIIPKYLELKKKEKNQSRLKKLLIQTRGCLSSMFWPKEISQKWMRFLSKTFYSASTSVSLKSETKQ